MMMHKSSGFILVTVLLFLFILTILITSFLQAIQLDQRITNYLAQYFTTMDTAVSALKEIENKLEKEELPTQDFFVFIERASNDWWQQQASLLNKHFQIYYYIDVLTTSPCIRLENTKISGARFYRITLRVCDDQNNALLLQTIYAKPVVLSDICYDQLKIIKPGEQSWHQIK